MEQYCIRHDLVNMLHIVPLGIFLQKMLLTARKDLPSMLSVFITKMTYQVKFI